MRWEDQELAALERATHGLTATLLSETLLEAPLRRLQVEAVLLNVLTDTFALNPTAEATGLLKRLILSNGDQNQGELLGRLLREPGL